jgi:hypothetical protein
MSGGSELALPRLATWRAALPAGSAAFQAACLPGFLASRLTGLHYPG